MKNNTIILYFQFTGWGIRQRKAGTPDVLFNENLSIVENVTCSTFTDPPSRVYLPSDTFCAKNGYSK